MRTVIAEDTATGWSFNLAARRVETAEQKSCPELVLTHHHSMEVNFAKDLQRKPSLAIDSHAVSDFIAVVVVAAVRNDTIPKTLKF